MSESCRATRLALLALCLSNLAGCADWRATPERLEADYGNSVRNMVHNQIYSPGKAQSPAALAPDGIEGVKADTALEQAYRKDLGRPEVVRQHTLLGTPGGSGAAALGGGAR